MKPIWKSKTLGFNFAAALLLFITNFATDNALIPNEWAAIVITVVNLILRFLTTKPIGTP